MEKDNILNDFESLSDEELVSLAHNGDDRALDYLLDKYRVFVRSKSLSYFIVGADRDDIVQEGMIGLFKAVRDFNNEHEVSFKAFANICVTRQILTAVKNATRQKHAPLNFYISLDKSVTDAESETKLLDVLESETVCDPEKIVLSKEKVDSFGVKISQILSNFELLVLSYYLKGYNYVKIAEILKKDPKSIDNALQRIRKKFEKISEALE